MNQIDAFDVPLIDRYVGRVIGDITVLPKGLWPADFLFHDLCETVRGKIFVSSGKNEVSEDELVIDWLCRVWQEALRVILTHQTRMVKGPVGVNFLLDGFSGSESASQNPQAMVLRPVKTAHYVNYAIRCEIVCAGIVVRTHMTSRSALLAWVLDSSREVSDRIGLAIDRPVLPPALDAYFNLLRSLTEP